MLFQASGRRSSRVSARVVREQEESKLAEMQVRPMDLQCLAHDAVALSPFDPVWCSAKGRRSLTLTLTLT